MEKNEAEADMASGSKLPGSLQAVRFVLPFLFLGLGNSFRLLQIHLKQLFLKWGNQE